MEDKIKLVKHLADLGMLTFSDEEMQTIVGDMQHIIELIDEIKEADVSGVKAKIIPVKYKNLRKDEAKESMDRKDILKNASQVQENCFVVPKVVD